MSKLERLLNLTAVLLDTDRPLSADAIRQRVEGYPDATASFRRAFERDKEDLRSLDIPLRVERIPGADPPLDGYRIPAEDYYLPDPGLAADELAALHLASMAVRLDGLGEREALWKLGGLADAPPDMADAVASVPTNPSLVPLFDAITAGRRVEFRYNDADRSVDPWRLDFQRGRWYLTGFDHGRDAERNFRLDRIDGAVVSTDEPITVAAPRRTVDGAPLRAWEIGEEPATLVELLVDATHVAWARQQFGPEVPVVERSDGSAVFTVPVVMREAFRSLVLEFLENAEVLGPVEFRTEMIDWLEAMAEEVEE